MAVRFLAHKSKPFITCSSLTCIYIACIICSTDNKINIFLPLGSPTHCILMKSCALVRNIPSSAVWHTPYGLPAYVSLLTQPVFPKVLFTQGYVTSRSLPVRQDASITVSSAQHVTSLTYTDVTGAYCLPSHHSNRASWNFEMSTLALIVPTIYTSG